MDIFGSLQPTKNLKKLNVNNSSEASEAKIMDKKYLEELSLSWSEDANDHFMNSQSEMDILAKLQPAKYLKMLRLFGYRGTRFPEWVGNYSYHNLTKLYLIDCRNCCILPPLGQLSSLKKLTMRRMNMLETIGYEYGDSFAGTPLFPSLEFLEFADMPCWEMWHHSNDLDDSFPLLKSIVIFDCPRLKGDLPSHLPMLETVKIERCSQLVSSLPKTFSIRELNILESNKVALHELPLSLKVLIIEGTQVIESVFEAIAITPTTSLQILDIRNCSSAISFPGDCLPTSLKELSITKCKHLNFPKQNHRHESLQTLRIDGSCDSLSTLPLDNLPNLDDLQILNCENIEHLPALKIPSNLVRIYIHKCLKFVSFPREGLSAPNLKILYVTNCTNLKSLPCHINTLLPKLHDVLINECPEMETFPEGGMPPSLRTLCIGDGEKLLRNPSLTLFDMLTKLYIVGPCDGVESFPNKGFALLPPSLTSLNLSRMSSLHTLECMGLLHLTSLRKLIIENCPQLENMEGERLPASLLTLEINRCPLLGERCRMKHPQIWPYISTIKGIKVDYKWI
ncbi:hypothetical protein QL285_006712 [Trifolium repens]|nr:hypothetical protein QL285_006712 [Trifolium repens]